MDALFFLGGIMFLLFFILLMLNGFVGVIVWLGWRRFTAHMRAHPEAAKLVAEHVIAPLLAGKEPDNNPPDKPEPKRIKGTLV